MGYLHPPLGNAFGNRRFSRILSYSCRDVSRFGNPVHVGFVPERKAQAIAKERDIA
jgi:hypothetical protein